MGVKQAVVVQFMLEHHPYNVVNEGNEIYVDNCSYVLKNKITFGSWSSEIEYWGWMVSWQVLW